MRQLSLKLNSVEIRNNYKYNFAVLQMQLDLAKHFVNVKYKVEWRYLLQVTWPQLDDSVLLVQ